MTTPLAPPTHDLCGAAPRTEDVLSLVDALAPGQLLTLRLSTETARVLLATLTAERKGLFEWSPEADGNALRVDVVRRDAAPGSKRGVFEALSWDHDRIDAFEQGAFAARAAGDLEAARALFDRFARGLFRHIGFEEDLLFPALESAAGLSPHAGPTAVTAARSIEPGGRLVVRAPFVPVPLFGVLAKRGFENETENLGPEGFRITFRSRTAAWAAGEP